MMVATQVPAARVDAICITELAWANPVRVRALRASDHEGWQRLAQAYKAEAGRSLGKADLREVWDRLAEDFEGKAMVLVEHDQLLGFAHFLFYVSTWGERVCCLTDLYVDPARRGEGLARRMIEALALQARSRGVQRLYWVAHARNAALAALGGRLAEQRGCVTYEFNL